jgi:hypothetical protein
MHHSYFAKLAAKRKARARSRLQSALGVALMVAIGGIGTYLAYLFYGHGCGC